MKPYTQAVEVEGYYGEQEVIFVVKITVYPYAPSYDRDQPDEGGYFEIESITVPELNLLDDISVDLTVNDFDNIIDTINEYLADDFESNNSKW